MCLEIEVRTDNKRRAIQKNIKIADKDIKVEKLVFTTTNKKVYESFIMNFEYERGYHYTVLFREKEK